MYRAGKVIQSVATMTGISLTAGFANGALAKQVRPDTPHAPRDHRALGRETTKIFPRDLEIPARVLPRVLPLHDRT